jgi:uncharacterized membrane protein
MQMEMRDQASAAAKAGQPLPPRCHQLFKLWFIFDFPTFDALATIFWLMMTPAASFVCHGLVWA